MDKYSYLSNNVALYFYFSEAVGTFLFAPKQITHLDQSLVSPISHHHLEVFQIGNVG